MKNEPLVYIIILNYNGYKDTIECIRSLDHVIYNNLKVVIVDNNSNDESLLQFHKLYAKRHQIIESDRNLGYAGGMNLGVNHAMKNNAEYICILNNDVIVEKDFLTKIIGYMELHDDAGIVGPRICEYNKPDIIQSTGANINFYRGLVPHINIGKNESEVAGQIIQCDYVIGACMVIKRKVIDAIGLMPEDYFLYYEETEWCYQAKRHRYNVICYCDSKILHKGSVSIGKVSGLSRYYLHRNRVVFVKRNVNYFKFLIFLTYLLIESTYYIIFKGLESRILKMYFDGLFNTTFFMNQLVSQDVKK